MEQIKVGIIGAGFIGKQHIEAVRRIPGLTVLALCDTNEKAGREIAQNLGIPEFYSDYREMMKNPELVSIHNCTPTHILRKTADNDGGRSDGTDQTGKGKARVYRRQF